MTTGRRCDWCGAKAERRWSHWLGRKGLRLPKRVDLCEACGRALGDAERTLAYERRPAVRARRAATPTEDPDA